MKYRAYVVRTSYAKTYIEVDGRDINEAYCKIDDQLGNHLYSEFDAEYSIEEIEEIN